MHGESDFVKEHARGKNEFISSERKYFVFVCFLWVFFTKTHALNSNLSSRYFNYKQGTGYILINHTIYSDQSTMGAY